MTVNAVLDYRKRILQKAKVNILPNQSVLDVGCGDGGDCELFSKTASNVIGIDILSHPSWSKIKKDNLEFQVADACNLPFINNIFDVVFVKDVLHHVPNHKKALHEVIRVTKEGGIIIVIEANRFNPIFYLHMTLMLGHQHFKKKYFKKLIESYSNDATFISTESHVYPIKNKLEFQL